MKVPGKTHFHWERAGNGREGGDGWEGLGADWW